MSTEKEEIQQLRSDLTKLTETVTHLQATVDKQQQTIAHLTSLVSVGAASSLPPSSPSKSSASRPPSASLSGSATPAKGSSTPVKTGALAKSSSAAGTPVKGSGVKSGVAAAPSASTSSTSSSSSSSAAAAAAAAAASHPEALTYFIQSRKISVLPPSSFVKADHNPLAPSSALSINHVYGFRGKDTFANLFLVDGGAAAIWNTAALVVVQNLATRAQRHFVGHTDDITCLSVNQQRTLAVSGQVCAKGKGEKAFLIVWDIASGRIVAQLGGKSNGGHGHDNAVACAAFSPDASTVLSIGADNEHTAILWNVAAKTPLYTVNGGQDKVLVLAANPLVAGQFVSAGVHHVSFWGPGAEEKSFARRKGVFGKKGDQQTVVSVAFSHDGSKVLTGTSKTGEILVWDAKSAQLVSSAEFNQPAGNSILSIVAVPDRPDHFVFTEKAKKARIAKLSGSGDSPLTALGEFAVGLEARAADVVGNTLVVGGIEHTAKAFSIDWSTHSGSGGDVITAAHAGEVWGLALHPSKHQFVSCADDKVLSVFDFDTHTLVASKALPERARSASFSCDGQLIAVGFGDGRFAVLDAASLAILGEKKERKEEISDLKFSPAKPNVLAVSSHDNFIDVYTVDRKGASEVVLARKAICKGHSSFVTHIDWSTDGTYLRSTSGDYELLFWEALTGKHVPSPKEVRDVVWASQNCVLGWAITGIWPPDSDGTDVNTVDAFNNALIATGSDDGFVRLFRYPCFEPGRNLMAQAKEYGSIHSAHVTSVRFTPDGSYLISAGGNDNTLIQWAVASN